MSSWFWFALVASVFWGLTYVVDQYLLRFVDAVPIVFLSSLGLSCVLGLYLVLTHQWGVMFHKFFGNGKLVGAMLLYTAIYLIASILILKSITHGNASLGAIVESAYPIFTLLFAYFLLHEKQFNALTLIGGGLIVVGLIIMNSA